MKRKIENCFTWLINQISQTIIYDWCDELKVGENKRNFNKFYDELKKHIDFTKLTVKEAKELRFGKWDDESDLYLFPLYLVPIIPENLEVISISGEKFKYKKEKTDNDIRFGCVAYGIEIKESENR